MKSSLKKNILITIASIAGLLLLVAAGLYLYFYLQFSSYQDDQYKFSMRYPKDWKVIVHPRENVAVIFIKPKETALDTLQETFYVTVQPVPADIFNLDAFTGRVRKQMVGVFEKSINIAEDKPIHWGWHQGHIMVFEASKPDHLKMINAWVLYQNQSYILTFLGDMNKFDQDKLYVDEMIRSFQLQ